MDDRQQMKGEKGRFAMRGRLFKLVFSVAAGTLIGVGAAAFVASKLMEAQPPDIQGLLWPNPKEVQPFALADQRGEPFTLEQLKSRWSFLFFGYTYCPDVCPTTLAMLDKVSRELGQAPTSIRDVQFVFVSVDPERDTPELLGKYVAYFNPNFLGVTGPDDALNALTRQLGIYAERGPPDANGDYLVGHGTAVLLIDPAGRLLGVFQAPYDPLDIAERFRLMRRFVEG
jgi:protein SCO1/2